MLTPAQESANPLLSDAAQRAYRRQELQRLGIAWPPVPYQRVEVTGNRFPHDPSGRLLGTVLKRDGSNTLVLLDCYGEPRLCYWDNELRPVTDDLQPGWVPYLLWKGYLAPTADRTLTYDLKTAEGSWCFGAYPKLQVTGDYQFQQVVKPYARYSPKQIAGIRPSEY